jgi:hypothetical protein
MPVLFRQAKDVLVDRKADAKDRQLEILVAMIVGKWLCCQLGRMASRELRLGLWIRSSSINARVPALGAKKVLSVQTSLLLVSLDLGC